MRVWAEIDLDRLKHNIDEIRKNSNNKKIMGIIKANAYGHGAIEIAEELSLNGVNIFGVACIDEAKELVENNIEGEILILGCTPIEEWNEIINYNISMTIASFDEIYELEKLKVYPKVHIKIDTGMGRIGFAYEKADEAITYIIENKLAEVEGIFTHLSSSESDLTYTSIQLEKFEKIVNKYPDIKYKHALNSGGVIYYQTICNVVRTGIIMYGITPFDSKQYNFQPILKYKSKIVFIKKLDKETKISYNGTYLAQKGEIIATVSAGYGDGISRKLSNIGKVIVKNIKCDIVGRICMDQFMIRIPNELSNLKIGEEVTIIGDIITAKEIAKYAETIPYEVLTSISNRVPRVYIKNGQIIQEKSLLGRKF